MGHAIVIDTCVARAAGESDDPVAQICRGTLDSITENDHRLAMSKPLQEEWFKSTSHHREPYCQYASMYALRWFVDMTSVRRVEWVELTDTADIQTRILFAVEPQNRALVEKDLHLVETALASDRRVISLDDRARSHFCNLGQLVTELCEVLWLNPRSCDVPKWLKEGASDKEHHRLCNVSDPAGHT